MIAAAFAVAGAGPASSADVTDVRVGIHPGFTRVVFETDAPAHFRTEKTPSGEIRVHLGAVSKARSVVSRSPILEGVRVDATGEGAVATLDLRGADVSVSEMVLSKPARIVLDLRRGAAGAAGSSVAKAAPPEAAKPVPAPEPAAEAKPASDWAEADAALAEAAPAPEAAESVAGAASDARRAADEARRAMDEMAAVPPPEGASPGSASEPSQAMADEPPAGEQVAEMPGSVLPSGADDFAMPGEEADAEALPAEPTDPYARPEIAEASPPALPAPAPQRPAPQAQAPLAPPPIAEPRGFTGFLPPAIDDPAIVGGLVAAVVLLGLLAAVRRRRPEPEEELASPFSADEPFSLDEAPASNDTQMGLPGLSSGEGGFAQAETPLRSPISFAPPETDVIGPLGGAEAAVAEAAAPGSSADDELASLFDHSEDDLSAPGGAQGEPMQTSTPTGYDSATSPFSRPSMPSAMSSAGGDVGALVQDLERRMKQLESQVEELIETKERLERQVAAQTEELRVQRAAIARTQRVLRTVVKPEEEATEPVPKV